MPTHCNFLRDLKDYISDEKPPHVDYCIIEIDDENFVPKHARDEIEVPISQGMRSYLVEWCNALMDDGDIGLFNVDEALLHDLQYIAERSHIPFDWNELRIQLAPYKSNTIHLILN